MEGAGPSRCSCESTTNHLLSVRNFVLFFIIILYILRTNCYLSLEAALTLSIFKFFNYSGASRGRYALIFGNRYLLQSVIYIFIYSGFSITVFVCCLSVANLVFTLSRRIVSPYVWSSIIFCEFVTNCICMYSNHSSGTTQLLFLSVFYVIPGIYNRKQELRGSPKICLRTGTLRTGTPHSGARSGL